MKQNALSDVCALSRSFLRWDAFIRTRVAQRKYVYLCALRQPIVAPGFSPALEFLHSSIQAEGTGKSARATGGTATPGCASQHHGELQRAYVQTLAPGFSPACAALKGGSTVNAFSLRNTWEAVMRQFDESRVRLSTVS